MKPVQKKILIFSLLLLFQAGCFSLFAQKHLTDSLSETVLKFEKEPNFLPDTNYVNTLIALSFSYRGSSADSVISVAQKAFDASQKINFREGLKKSRIRMANGYRTKSDYANALEICFHLLRDAEKSDDKIHEADILYIVATIYFNREKYDETLIYADKLLKISNKAKYDKGIAYAHNAFAIVYDKQKKYVAALENYGRCLDIHRKNNNRLWISIARNNMAYIYLKQNRLALALDHLQAAEKIAREMEIKGLLSEILAGIGEVYLLKKDFKKALSYAQKALKVSEEVGSKVKIREAHNLLYRLYKTRNETGPALMHFEKFRIYDDSIQNITIQNRAVELRARYEFDKKASLMQAEQDKKNLAYRAELEQQRRLQNTFIALISIAFIILLFFGIGYKQKRKANQLLGRQNREIARQKDDLNQSNEELKQQQEELVMLNENLALGKHELEKTYGKLKQTSGQLEKSIRYASHIQAVILAEETDLRTFFSDIFVLYRAKDTVSGDFYWFSRINENLGVFALGDCTGHGVPGAFMSMLGSALLHETVNTKEIHFEPGRALKNIHSGLRKILKQHQGKNDDGIDISVCVFHKKPEAASCDIIFAGAKSKMYYIADKEVVTLQGDRQCLGGKNALRKDFTDQKFSVKNSTPFYFFSDGIIDQNNAQRKRIGSKNFKEQLLLNAEADFPEQQQKLEHFLDSYQDKEEQRDDISVVGLRL